MRNSSFLLQRCCHSLHTHPPVEETSHVVIPVQYSPHSFNRYLFLTADSGNKEIQHRGTQNMNSRLWPEYAGTGGMSTLGVGSGSTILIRQKAPDSHVSTARNLISQTSHSASGPSQGPGAQLISHIMVGLLWHKHFNQQGYLPRPDFWHSASAHLWEVLHSWCGRPLSGSCAISSPG